MPTELNSNHDQIAAQLRPYLETQLANHQFWDHLSHRIIQLYQAMGHQLDLKTRNPLDYEINATNVLQDLFDEMMDLESQYHLYAYDREIRDFDIKFDTFALRLQAYIGGILVDEHFTPEQRVNNLLTLSQTLVNPMYHDQTMLSMANTVIDECKAFEQEFAELISHG